MAAAPAGGAHDGPQSKFWCVTISHLESPPDPAWPMGADGKRRRPVHLRQPLLYAAWRLPARARARMEIFKYQAELGAGAEDPNDGFLHVQCFFVLKAKCRSQPLRVLLGLEGYSYHSEPTRNPPASWDYCMKDDTRLEGAETQSQGERPSAFKDRGLSEAQKDAFHMEALEAVKRGADDEWFTETPDRRKFFRGTGYQVKTDLLKDIVPKDGPRKLIIYWFFGDTGCGKTAIIKHWGEGLGMWESPADGRPFGTWFPGYKRNKYAVIDDFDGITNFRQFLRILDVYERMVGIKHGDRVFKPEVMFITSDRPPKRQRAFDLNDHEDVMKWGMDPDESKRRELSDKEWDQLFRRIDESGGGFYEFKNEIGRMEDFINPDGTVSLQLVNCPPMPRHPLGVWRETPELVLKNGRRVRPVYPPLVPFGPSEAPPGYVPPPVPAAPEHAVPAAGGAPDVLQVLVELAGAEAAFLAAPPIGWGAVPLLALPQL